MIPFIEAMQNRVAEVAIGASTVRGQGASGIADNARRFLSALRLADFATSDHALSLQLLDQTTVELRRTLPAKARSWGLARKCLNIFLRDAFYNVYLVEEFDLTKAEPWYEVPIDGKVVDRLRKKAGRGVLPRWTGVKGLQPDQSVGYQRFAQQYAVEIGQGLGMPFSRVHLDLYLWRA